MKHSPPKLLHTDKELKFKNKEFRTMLSKYNIKLYHTENCGKSAIVERFNRTLNGKMKVEFEYSRNKRLFDMLQDLVNKYNYTVYKQLKLAIEVEFQPMKKHLKISIYIIGLGKCLLSVKFKIPALLMNE